MKYFRPIDYLSTLIFAWAFIVLALNFVIPTSWYFQYERLETTDVCVNEEHKISGLYWALFEIPAEGVDHIVNENGKRKDRFPWDKGVYKQGDSVGGWSHKADLLPGTYRIESTELQLRLFRVFPVYLDKDERPVSNWFEVVECEE